MTFHRVEDLHRALDSGQTTCVQLVQESLRKARAENPSINAVAEFFEGSAMEQALAVDARRAQGDRRALDGVTMVIKDNMVYRNHASGASSKILTGFISPYTATAVQRVVDAGACIVGRSNCDEFAMGSSNETSVYGPVRNPLDLNRTPGGSSGGSAAAVAAGWVHASLGSDTGGSIRQPASFCGIFGAKPTYGRVSRYGLIAYASSFDQIGPLARSANDLARITEVISGADQYDGTCSDRPVPSMSDKSCDPRSLSFGYYQEVLDNPALDSELRDAFMARMNQLRAEGHRVEALRFDYLDALVPIYYILTTAEASANLARFDGVRYGYRAEGVKTLDELYKRSRSEGFGTEVKRRILLGTFVLRSGFFDAYYGKAQKARRAVQNATNADLAKVDLLISPTSPHTAFELGREASDPTLMYLEDIFTVQAPIAGLPALSLPMGLHSNGMPMGLHLTAKAFDEPTLFTAAEYLSS